MTVTIHRTHEQMVAIITAALEARGVKVHTVDLTCSAGQCPGNTKANVVLYSIQGDPTVLTLSHHQILEMVCKAQTAKGYPAPQSEPRFSALVESECDPSDAHGPTRYLSPIIAQFVYQDHEIMASESNE